MAAADRGILVHFTLNAAMSDAGGGEAYPSCVDLVSFEAV